VGVRCLGNHDVRRKGWLIGFSKVCSFRFAPTTTRNSILMNPASNRRKIGDMKFLLQNLLIAIIGKRLTYARLIAVATHEKDGWKIVPNLSREDLEYALTQMVHNWDLNSESSRLQRVEEETRINACLELLKGAQKTLEGILKATDSMSPRKSSHL
jgi:hypothetical protein